MWDYWRKWSMQLVSIAGGAWWKQSYSSQEPTANSNHCDINETISSSSCSIKSNDSLAHPLFIGTSAGTYARTDTLRVRDTSLHSRHRTALRSIDREPIANSQQPAARHIKVSRKQVEEIKICMWKELSYRIRQAFTFISCCAFGAQCSKMCGIVVIAKAKK